MAATPSSVRFPAGKEAPRGYRYRSVIDVILGMIADGALNPGDRAPSLRELSERLSLSVATIMRAYAELERLGHLETRPQSGHYVSFRARPAAPAPSAPKPMPAPRRVDRSELIEEIHRAMTDPAIVPLSGAVPSRDLLPGRDLARLAKQVLGDPGTDAFRYGEVQGDPELRRQIAFHLLDAGAKVRMDDLVVTVGATEALSLALQVLTRPGDAVIVESPTYFGFLLKFEAFGLRALEIPTDPERGPDLAALQRALSHGNVKACLFQPNFGNPTGGLYPPEGRRDIYRMVTGAGLPLIEDDLYGDLCFGDKRPPSFLEEDDRGMVVHVGAFSKVLAPGFRVGWLRGGRWHDAMLRMKAANTLASPQGLQMVLARFLAEGRFKRHIRSLRSRLRTQVATYTAHIRRAFPPGTCIASPKGSFVLWIELPEGVDAMTLYRQAMARGIGITPGPMFSAQDRYDNFIRVNCGNPMNDRIGKAIETVGQLAAQLAAKQG